MAPYSVAMPRLFRATAPLAILAVVALLSAPPLLAQRNAGPSAGPGKNNTDAQDAAAAARPAPWLYKGSDVPPDREWIFGELPNGVRYAVRRNGVPPGQVSIRVRMDVGSLYERDNERGYAHLLEHLVFRQSKYLAEGQAIPTWQRLGATFGSDTNAETSHIGTTYKLDLPNATPASLDTSFKLLSGMMIGPTLSEANVRTEVPIVLAEKRERGGVGERVADASQETFFSGMLLATRSPIGTVETLTAANQASVRAFHQRWYRPERAVVIAAGDADPAQLEALITRYFGGWKGVGKATPEPNFGDPVAPGGADPVNPIGEAKVVVEPDLPRTFSFAVLRPWRPVNDTIAYNQGLMLDSLAQSIINRRLEGKARTGGSYLAAEVAQEDVSRSTDATFVTVMPLGEDWQGALKDVRGVIADALDTAPTQAEIDREVAEMNVAFESSVEQRRLLPGSKVADDLVRALDIRETVAAPEGVLSIFQRSKPLFTPAAVLEHARALFKGSVTRAMYVTPKAGEADAGAIRTALLAPVVPDRSARVAPTALSFKDLPALGAPASPTAAKPLGLLRIEQLDFANGVKVLIWPTRDEPGRVTVKVRFGAGWRAFKPEDAPYVTIGEMALISSGIGPLNENDIDRIATGRKLGFDFKVDDGTFEFSADTRPADMADQLYLLAAKFGTPRWDAPPVLRAKAAARLAYESYGASPQGVFERDLDFLQRGRDPRFRSPTPAEIETVTPEGFRKVWEPVLSQGPIEVHMFGDFTRADALAALEKSFGALKARGPLPASTTSARMMVPTASTTPVVLMHRGAANQSAALISWPTGGGAGQIAESRQVEVLAEVFSNRLMARMREKLGASYSPQVFATWPVDLENGGAINALAQLEPKQVPIFYAAAEEIAADLIARPPTAEELALTVEPLRQQLSRATSSSAFFMYMLEGATSDPARIGSVRTVMRDYTEITPGQVQALAKKYLGAGSSWRLAVIPQGQTLATTVPAAPARPSGR